MCRRIRYRLATLPALTLLLLLGACAGGRDFTYTPPDEIKSGPGILSGKDGEFVLYRR